MMDEKNDTIPAPGPDVEDVELPEGYKILDLADLPPKERGALAAHLLRQCGYKPMTTVMADGTPIVACIPQSAAPAICMEIAERLEELAAAVRRAATRAPVNANAPGGDA